MSGIDIIIGIDPGRRTGIAVKDLKKDRLVRVDTCELWEAWETVESAHEFFGGRMAVVIEDARLGGGHWKRAQGAGSVKRDSSAWEEFLRGKGIPFVALSPRDAAKGKHLTVKQFRKYTGFEDGGRITEHARDAGMMILAYTEKVIEAQLMAMEIRKRKK